MVLRHHGPIALDGPVPVVVQRRPAEGGAIAPVPAHHFRYDVDPDREDLEVIAARWAEYPRWFQDGMMFKYPRLRDL